MLRICQMFLDLGISRRDLSRYAGGKWTKDQITDIIKNEHMPRLPYRREMFVSFFTELCKARQDCMTWLGQRSCSLESLWESVGAQPVHNKIHGISKGSALIPGDPLLVEEEEAIMLNHRTIRHFRLFRSPFVGELNSPKDIFQSEEHIFLRDMMLETARNMGFTAVCGECGCGKSIMRKIVAMQLMSDGIKVIFPRIIDKARITPASIIDAIVMDMSDESPKQTLEAKTRQAERLLKNRAASRQKQVIIIEEAHLLSVKSFKSLKQIHEFEDGFSKMLGIILIGQPELKYLLDEGMHPELREVIRRITVTEIKDLDKETRAYLKHKFDRVGSGKFDEIFTSDCIDAILQRLPGKTYPLTVNNLVARAMNLAAEMGELKVTAEVVLAA